MSGAARKVPTATLFGATARDDFAPVHEAAAFGARHLHKPLLDRLVECHEQIPVLQEDAPLLTGWAVLHQCPPSYGYQHQDASQKEQCHSGLIVRRRIEND